jgi:GT2 family glycosyltransferase
VPQPPFRLSVVVPTYNRVARLRHVIEALAQQTYPADAYEVVVVSDGSSDGTDRYLQTVRTPMRLRWFSQSNRGPAAARNAGVEQADGEFIVFIDDDVVAEPQLLAEHVRAHQEADGEVAVMGPLLTPEGFAMAPWVRWEQEMLSKQYSAMLRGRWHPTARQFYTGNASVRRSHILAAGGFDESFRRAEDVELAYRLAARGVGFVFTMKAAAKHFAERSYRSWLDGAYAYGRNDARFARDRGQSWLLPVVHQEFGERHILARALVRLCRGRPRIGSAAAATLKLAADAASLIHAERAERAAYSGLFNLRYCSGLLDELGDPGFLFRRIAPPVEPVPGTQS